MENPDQVIVDIISDPSWLYPEGIQLYRVQFDMGVDESQLVATADPHSTALGDVSVNIDSYDDIHKLAKIYIRQDGLVSPAKVKEYIKLISPYISIIGDIKQSTNQTSIGGINGKLYEGTVTLRDETRPLYIAFTRHYPDYKKQVLIISTFDWEDPQAGSTKELLSANTIIQEPTTTGSTESTSSTGGTFNNYGLMLNSGSVFGNTVNNYYDAFLRLYEGLRSESLSDQQSAAHRSLHREAISKPQSKEDLEIRQVRNDRSQRIT